MVIHKAKVNMLKETAFGSVCVCLYGSSNQTTDFTPALHISWKTNTISHLLWGCHKQFETSSTRVVYFTAYLGWIKSVCLYNMHAWNLFRLTSSKYQRWFQFELFFFKHYITVRLQSRTQLPVSQLSLERFWLFLAVFERRPFSFLFLPENKCCQRSLCPLFLTPDNLLRFLICYSFLFCDAPQKLSNMINKWSKCEQL